LPSKFDEIEKMIMTEMRKVYSEKAIEYAMNPRNVGRMEKADGFARITGPCRDTMEIYLKACGSIATELIKGKSISEALKINSKSLLDVLGGLPDSDIHCSVLVSSTLKAAIQDYVDRRKRE
jgi:nitrogen fixation NifU-like protein